MAVMRAILLGALVWFTTPVAHADPAAFETCKATRQQLTAQAMASTDPVERGRQLAAMPICVRGEDGTTEIEEAPAPEHRGAPKLYIGGGMTIGADRMIDSGLTLELGYRLGGSVWLHGLGVRGEASEVDKGEMGKNGSFLQARGGIEVRSTGTLGVLAGLDVGYQYESALNAGTEYSHDGVRAYPRIGLDCGGERVRFRPVFTLDVGSRVTGGALALDAAVQW
jgi:hypothetical protein